MPTLHSCAGTEVLWKRPPCTLSFQDRLLQFFFLPKPYPSGAVTRTKGEIATVATEIWAHQQGLKGKLGIRKLEIPGTEVLKARAAKDTKELIRKVLSGELTSGRALRGLWEFQGSES